MRVSFPHIVQKVHLPLLRVTRFKVLLQTKEIALHQPKPGRNSLIDHFFTYQEQAGDGMAASTHLEADIDRFSRVLLA